MSILIILRFNIFIHFISKWIKNTTKNKINKYESNTLTSKPKNYL